MPKRCAICHSHAQPSDVVVAAIERRAEAQRDRRQEERRMFPRPEGRRMDDGRRDGDSWAGGDEPRPYNRES